MNHEPENKVDDTRPALVTATAKSCGAPPANAAAIQQPRPIDAARAELTRQAPPRVFKRNGGSKATPTEPPGAWLRRVAAALGAAVTVIGLLVSIAWPFGLDTPGSSAPGTTRMTLDAALCFVLAGLALVLREHRGLRLAGAAIIVLLGALSVAGPLIGVGVGLDQLLARDPGDPHIAPGRMGHTTAWCFVWSGAALMLRGRRGRVAGWAQQALSLGTAVLGLFALLGYLHRTQQAPQFIGFGTMPLPAAAAFLLLGVGLLCTRPNGLVAELTRAGPGARLARYLLPATVLAPVILGWLHVAGERSGFDRSAASTELFALAMILSLSAFVWVTGRILNREEAARRATERQFRNQAELMEQARDALVARENEERLRQLNAELQAANASLVESRSAAVKLLNDALAARQRAEQSRAELQATNQILETSRRAALNLMEDALDARQQAEQAGEALRESEARYRAIGESINYGVWVCTPDGRNTYASESFLKLVGLTQQQCSDFGWSTVLDPADAARTLASWKECTRTGGIWDIEHRFRGVDGKYHAMLARGVPVRNERGEIACWVGINLDISRLKQAEEALRRSNARLDLLAETASELLRTDSAQRVVETLCRKVMAFLDCEVFFNFLVEEGQAAPGGTPPSVPPRRLHLNACAGIPEEEQSKIEWLDYGVAVCGCAARDACRIIAEDIPETPDPRTELIKRYGLRAYACHPLMAQGRVIGTLSFGTRNRSRFTDEELSLMNAVADQVAIAMQRRQAEEGLRQLNAQLEQRVAERTAQLTAVAHYARSLLEASLDPLVTISPEGTITDVNKATELITGVERARLIGSSFSDYFTEPQRAGAGYQRVLSQGVVRDYPLTIRHVSGRTTDVLYNATVYRNQAGEVQGVFAAARDITERRRAEAELHAANKELEAFCYSVSHDLRAPLRGIDGFSQALLEDCGDRLDAQGHQDLRWIRAQCQAMGQLIDDLLNLSRLTRAAMDRQPVDLTALAEEIARDLQQTAPKRRVQFHITKGLKTEGDPRLLRVLLSNLLENAWKYTSRRSDAQIEFGSVPARALAQASPGRTGLQASRVFFVRDNGVGFDMAYASKLFAPFQRLHSVNEFPGTGIGLATAQRVMHRHGGRIWVDAAVDQGATFYFVFAREERQHA